MSPFRGNTILEKLKYSHFSPPGSKPASTSVYVPIFKGSKFALHQLSFLLSISYPFEYHHLAFCTKVMMRVQSLACPNDGILEFPKRLCNFAIDLHANIAMKFYLFVLKLSTASFGDILHSAFFLNAIASCLKSTATEGPTTLIT